MNERTAMLGTTLLALAVASCEARTPPPTSPSRTVESRCFGRKLALVGVVETDLLISTVAQGPPGPEVILVKLDPVVQTKDGRYKVPVEQLEVGLTSAQNKATCDASPACVQFRDCFGSDYRLDTGRTCSGAFVSEHEIVTAAHCLVGSEWQQTFGIIGFRTGVDWEIVEGSLLVPASHVVRFCHLHSCVYSEHRGPDFARVHVCPVLEEGFVVPRWLEYADREPEPGDPLVARTHGWGLPAKTYEARFVPGAPPTARFTNFGGGSGGAVVDGQGKLVGVVRGFIDHSTFLDCSASCSEHCKGQRITWLNTFRDLAPGSQCEKDHPIPYAHAEDCAGIGDPAPSKTEKRE